MGARVINLNPVQLLRAANKAQATKRDSRVCDLNFEDMLFKIEIG